MRHKLFGKGHAGGEIGLQAEAAGAASGIRASRGKQGAEAGRKGESRFTAANELIAVVDPHIPESRTRVRKRSRMLQRDGVAQLMAYSGSGPLLGERVGPVFAVPVARKGGNVLHDPVFLVVGFLYQK